ncbi:unnamed protein product [Prunus armeniaca]
MEFRPPVGLLIPGRGLVPGNPAYQPNNPPVGLFSPGRLCQNFGRMSRVFSKWAQHRGDVGTKTGSAPVSGEIPGRVLSNRLQKTDGEQIFMMPYNPGAKKETVYFLDPLPGNRVVDEEAKNILNNAIKIYNSHIGRHGRKATIWKTLPGTPKQPSSVECGYYVMRFMRDIIMDSSLEFEKTLNNHCLWIAVCEGKRSSAIPPSSH